MQGKMKLLSCAVLVFAIFSLAPLRAQAQPQYFLLFNTCNYNRVVNSDGCISGTSQTLDTASLASAAALGNQCGCISPQFLIEISPSGNHADLDGTISQMQSLGYSYYVIGGASDYGLKSGLSSLFWDSGAMCYDMEYGGARMQGVYLKEVISAVYSAWMNGDFTSSPWPSFWQTIGAYASCAQTYGKKIVWQEFAGGWGWDYLIGQLNDSSSAGYQVINEYKNVFVFLWANNRSVQNAGQLSDMLEAQKDVMQTLHVAASNSLSFSFPVGISSQDWLWQEMGGCNAESVGGSPCAAPNMPQSLAGGFAINNLLHGGTYFEFESWWSGVAPNFSGQSDPCYYQSISDFVQFATLFATGSVPTPVTASSQCSQ